MPTPRIGTDEQMELALDDLAQLGSQVGGLSVAKTGRDQVTLFRKDGGGWPAKVIVYDAVGEPQARQLVGISGRGRKVVVANQISAAAREYLAARGWSWLDRRVGAHIADDGRDIEVRYVPRDDITTENGSPVLQVTSPAADGPIRGRAGIAYAAALLCHPNDPPSFRSVADAVGMSPTAISNAVKRLAEAGLVGPDNHPTLPELFWTLGEVWKPLNAAPIASAPNPGERELHARVDQLDGPGWVLGGDLAAAKLGAPVLGLDQRPWLWVPTQVELRRATRGHGSAKWSDRAAVIAVPPTPLVCLWRHPDRRGPWPVVQPVFAALDLARDPGRGREILSHWVTEGVDAVWR